MNLQSHPVWARITMNFFRKNISASEKKMAGEKPERSEWKPVYTDSKAVSFDPSVAEKNRVIGIFPESPEIDYYKILRTQIRHRARSSNCRTLMITSVNPGEGKTVTAINLAITFAREINKTVLLVDADLMRQNVHKYIGFPNDKGLIDYLVGERPLKEFIVWPGIERLTVISGGRTIYDSSELLGSPRMESLIEEMKNRYPDRYVLFDVPPILGGADSIVLSELIDGILIVVQEGSTSVHDVNKALEMLPREKVLGFVLNRQKNPVRNYYYTYRR